MVGVFEEATMDLRRGARPVLGPTAADMLQRAGAVRKRSSCEVEARVCGKKEGSRESLLRV